MIYTVGKYKNNVSLLFSQFVFVHGALNSCVNTKILSLVK
jgi:hypothetical protein